VTRPDRSAPEPPRALVVRIGRELGKARVAVDETGMPRGRYVAQRSFGDPDREDTWSDLPGVGKERRLSGYASGTWIWVRFAAVRFGMQSAWSAPTLVVIP
jgi:hypothetical protein